MHFDSWRAAWEMAGHGAFVWSAMAITGLVLLWLVWWPWLRTRRLVHRERRRHDLQAAVLNRQEGR